MYISSILLKHFTNDEQKIHAELLNCFNSNRLKNNILYRKNIYTKPDANLGLALLVYSDIAPVSTRNAMVQDSTLIEPEKTITDGMPLCFSVVASPITKHNGKASAINDPAKRIEWLKNKMRDHGAEIASNIIERPHSLIHMDHKYGRGHISAYTYFGMLRVTNAADFIDLFHTGLGRGKAYGCGLIELRKCN